MRKFLFLLLLAPSAGAEHVFTLDGGSPLQASADKAVNEALIERLTMLEERVARDEKIHDAFISCWTTSLAGASADLVSTAASIKFANAKEANPFGFSVEARVGLKFGMLASEGVACYEAAKAGSGKWSKVLKIASGLIHGALTANNVVQTIKGDNK